MDWFKRLVVTLLAGGSCSLLVADELLVQQAGKSVSLVGNILVEAQDGGLLFETRDSRLWIIQPDQIVQRSDADEVVKPFDAKELKAQLQTELPESFRYHTTDHFLICHNTDDDYAKWVGDIYERLHREFKEYWAGPKRKYALAELERPLVVVIYRNREEYAQQVRRELNTEPGTMVAYFNIDTNRVTMYDLIAELGPTNRKNRNINAILANPNAIPMVTTMVHEGTHQLMFNCGMQTRRADTPLWLNEGLAMFFETPDLNNRKGWGKVGQVNLSRLARFRQYLGSRNLTSLTELLQDDQKLRPDYPQVLDRYAEAWAFNYFLLDRHSSSYVAYLKHMAAKKPCVFDSPEQRLAEFEMFFQKKLGELDSEFIKYMQGLIGKYQ